jgi:hypothetical protein
MEFCADILPPACDKDIPVQIQHSSDCTGERCKAFTQGLKLTDGYEIREFHAHSHTGTKPKIGWTICV